MAVLRIKELCKDQGQTLQWLAKSMNISYQSLYESLNGNPSLNRLQEIAETLGVNIYDLFENPYNTPPSSSTFACPHCGKPIHIKIE